MFGMMGWQEIVLIMLVLILLFGGKRMAELGKGMGEGINSFRRGLTHKTDDKE